MTQAAQSRREMLEQFVAANPGDAFARYGLAMECANLGDTEAAGQHFRALLAAHPDYLYGYFHYGQLLLKVGRADEAKQILQAGVAAAQKKGDAHALDELQGALREIA
jgi:predicted Zn-dependent protease